MQYELVWTEDESLPDWDPEKHVVLESEPVTDVQERKKCNTRKDRDKRLNRHTCGIFIG